MEENVAKARRGREGGREGVRMWHVLTHTQGKSKLLVFGDRSLIKAPLKLFLGVNTLAKS